MDQAEKLAGMERALDRAMFGHTDEESAYEVDDYPYGFKLRTTIRYWIETTKNGDRFCSQTRNPKKPGEPWNKAKKSTYCDVGVMFMDDQDHVQWAGLTTWSDEAIVRRFLERTGDKLSKAQRTKVARILGIQKAYEGVTTTIHVNPTTEESAEIERSNQETFGYIAKRAAVETFHAKNEIVRDFGFASK